MIQFFRKIRQNLLNEGKTTKYFKYAIGEIVLVVIGILIALSINNWNQNRVNAKEEQRIMQDLTEELAFNKFLHANGTMTMNAVIDAAEYLLKLDYNPKNQIDSTQIALNIDKLSWVWVSGRNTTIYDVLSGSGDFNLISSPVLRKKLADLKANQESLLQFEQLQNRFVDQQLRPFLNRIVDRTTIRSSLIAAVMTTTEHPSNFNASYDQLFNNREFSNLLVDLIFFTDRVTSTYIRIEKDIYQIDSLIISKYPNIQAKPYVPY